MANGNGRVTIREVYDLQQKTELRILTAIEASDKTLREWVQLLKEQADETHARHDDLISKLRTEIDDPPDGLSHRMTRLERDQSNWNKIQIAFSTAAATVAGVFGRNP